MKVALVHSGSIKRFLTYAASVTIKNCQISIKIAQNDFTRKIIDFDSFTKIALECGRFGQSN